MKQQDIFKKIGVIIQELNEQYSYLQTDEVHFNPLELELFIANAHFLKDHAEILKKVISHQAAAPVALLPEPPQADTVSLLEEVPLPPLAESAVVFDPWAGGLPADDTGSGDAAGAVVIEPEVSEPEIIEPETPEPEEEPVEAANVYIPFEEVPAEAQSGFAEVPPVETQQPVTEVLPPAETITAQENTPEIEIAPVHQTDVRSYVREPEIQTGSSGFSISSHREPEPVPEHVDLSPVAAAAPAAVPEPPVAVPAPPAPEQVPLTLNERLSAQLNGGQQKPAAFSGQPVPDIKSIINMNDKMLFVKDLFNGYSLAYSEAIELLNRCKNFEEADRFLKSNYVAKNNWTEKQTSVDKFYALLKRRFAQ